MTAWTGSMTRKYTTASTVMVTLSRVMPSCAGTGIVTVCMFTLTSRSIPNGKMSASPGPRAASRSRPNRNTTPRSYCRIAYTPVRTANATTTSTTATSSHPHSDTVTTSLVQHRHPASVHPASVHPGSAHPASAAAVAPPSTSDVHSTIAISGADVTTRPMPPQLGQGVSGLPRYSDPQDRHASASCTCSHRTSAPARPLPATVLVHAAATASGSIPGPISKTTRASGPAPLASVSVEAAARTSPHSCTARLDSPPGQDPQRPADQFVDVRGRIRRETEPGVQRGGDHAHHRDPAWCSTGEGGRGERIRNADLVGRNHVRPAGRNRPVGEHDHLTRPAVALDHGVQDQHRLAIGDLRQQRETEGAAVGDLHAGQVQLRHAAGGDDAEPFVAEQLVADAEDEHGRPLICHTVIGHGGPRPRPGFSARSSTR